MALCHVCGTLLSNAYALQRHISTHHGTYVCETCEKNFQDANVFSNHRYSCKSLCKYCDLEFSKLSETKEHVARHHQDKQFQCTKCKKKFTAKRNLKKHVQHCRSLVSALLLYSTKVLTFSRGQCSIVINPQSIKSI